MEEFIFVDSQRKWVMIMGEILILKGKNCTKLQVPPADTWGAIENSPVAVFVRKEQRKLRFG